MKRQLVSCEYWVDSDLIGTYLVISEPARIDCRAYYLVWLDRVEIRSKSRPLTCVQQSDQGNQPCAIQLIVEIGHHRCVVAQDPRPEEALCGLRKIEGMRRRPLLNIPINDWQLACDCVRTG